MNTVPAGHALKVPAHLLLMMKAAMAMIVTAAASPVVTVNGILEEFTACSTRHRKDGTAQDQARGATRPCG